METRQTLVNLKRLRQAACILKQEVSKITVRQVERGELECSAIGVSAAPEEALWIRWRYLHHLKGGVA